MGERRVNAKKHESPGKTTKRGKEGKSVDILENWGYIEADFQREYGIDVSEEIGSITWRRFYNLLSGLSGESNFSHLGRSDSEPAKERKYIDEIM